MLAAGADPAPAMLMRTRPPLQLRARCKRAVVPSEQQLLYGEWLVWLTKMGRCKVELSPPPWAGGAPR